MGKDILSKYGRDADKPQAARASTGGVKSARDVMNYKPPQGPKGIMDRPAPGLRGDKFGNTNGPDRAGKSSGSAGLGGDNCGKCGSQGRY